MSVGRPQVLDRINIEWINLQGAIENVPNDQLEGPSVVGTWSAKDMMGHITTWEVEVLNNVERFLDPKIGEMRSYPDPDGFNERTLGEKGEIPLIDIQRDLWETHSRLLKFLQDLPGSAFTRDEVNRRIRLDTYEHYAEHAESFRDFVAPGLQ